MEREVPVVKMNVLKARIKGMQADCRAESTTASAAKVKKVRPLFE